MSKLLNQYSPVPRARSSTAGKDAARAQTYAGLGNVKMKITLPTRALVLNGYMTSSNQAPNS